MARWEEGERTGIYNLIIPQRPADMEEMPMADEFLLAVAGGSDDDCCCCT